MIGSVALWWGRVGLRGVAPGPTQSHSAPLSPRFGCFGVALQVVFVFNCTQMHSTALSPYPAFLGPIQSQFFSWTAKYLLNNLIAPQCMPNPSPTFSSIWLFWGGFSWTASFARSFGMQEQLLGAAQARGRRIYFFCMQSLVFRLWDCWSGGEGSAS